MLVQNTRNVLISTCTGNKSQLTVGALVVGVLVGDDVGGDVGDAVIPSQVTGSPDALTISPVHSLSELQHETTAA